MILPDPEKSNTHARHTCGFTRKKSFNSLSIANLFIVLDLLHLLPHEKFEPGERATYSICRGEKGKRASLR